MTLHAHVFPTSAAPMLAVVDDAGAVVALLFENGRDLRQEAAALARAHREDLAWDEAACRAARTQVEEYFAGSRQRFDLPLAPRGTAFQRAVWRELETIPYGVTTTYGELAARLGRPGAARAVGRANATNPICLALPCHRVVGADGSLTGYGGGIHVKERLLALEGQAQRLDPEPVGARGDLAPDGGRAPGRPTPRVTPRDARRRGRW